jgi:hypothetical protein
MKKIQRIVLSSCACLPLCAYGDSPEFVKRLKCQVSKCKVKCFTDQGEWIVVGQAEAVTINILRNGVAYFQLDKGAEGEESIIVGRDSLYCKVEDQK